jgi:hypothetical protein
MLFRTARWSAEQPTRCSRCRITRQLTLIQTSLVLGPVTGASQQTTHLCHISNKMSNKMPKMPKMLKTQCLSRIVLGAARNVKLRFFTLRRDVCCQRTALIWSVQYLSIQHGPSLEAVPRCCLPLPADDLHPRWKNFHPLCTLRIDRPHWCVGRTCSRQRRSLSVLLFGAIPIQRC